MMGESSAESSIPDVSNCISTTSFRLLVDTFANIEFSEMLSFSGTPASAAR